MIHPSTHYSIAFIILLSFFAFSSCNKQERKETDHLKEYTINGEIKNFGKNKILLQQVVEEKLITKDSTETDEAGKFVLKTKAPENDFYVLKLNDTLGQLIILDAGQIKVSADAAQFFKTFDVEGSKATSDYLNFNKNYSTFAENENSIKSAIPRQISKNNLDSLKIIQKTLEKAQSNSVNFVKQYIDSIIPSLAVFNLIQYISVEKDFEYVVGIAKRLQKEMPESKYTKLLNDEVNKMLTMQRKIQEGGVAIGAQAPEIKLPDQNGNIISLSSLRGKFVLIDFWASWCGPCRAENPNVVKVYKQYKNKNFEIFGVSLDRDKVSWMDAIKKDGLEWTHVSDLKFWNSEVVPLYAIDGIPATYLIDREGKVIAKNLRGAALEEKLREIIK